MDTKAVTAPKRSVQRPFLTPSLVPSHPSAAGSASSTVCSSHVHFILKKHVSICNSCCTRAIKERSTSETCSEAVLKVPIMFYNVEELIKEQAKQHFALTQVCRGKR